jgi:hypothetical protein
VAGPIDGIPSHYRTVLMRLVTNLGVIVVGMSEYG